MIILFFPANERSSQHRKRGHYRGAGINFWKLILSIKNGSEWNTFGAVFFPICLLTFGLKVHKILLYIH